MCSSFLYNLIEMIYSKEYLNLYLSVRNSLHIDNVEKITYDQLAHIGKNYDDELFTHYKKVVLLKWVYKNIENKISFYKRVKKLIKKLEVELTDAEMLEIESIEAREFTEQRAFKTIEVPYRNLTETTESDSILLLPHAYFFYKGLRTYRRRKLLFEKLFEGEIYITLREIVLYDRVENKIQLVIPNRTIDGITLKSEYVEIKRNNEDPIYLRYRDNELIFISLKRAVTIKGGEGFNEHSRDEFITTERTIESFLNIPHEEFKSSPSKLNKRKTIKRK